MQLRATAVHKRFGDVVALAGVDLTVDDGTHLLLAGANGAGKTTLLRLMAGLAAPSAGTITIDGDDPRHSPAHRQRLGLLSHQSLLYDDLTASENLRFFARLYGADESLVDAALAQVGLGAFANARAGGFSRGMTQRLALARATMHAPSMLFLDEPFTGLDRPSVESLTQRLRQRRQDPSLSSVLVTHRVAEAATLINRVIVLRGANVAIDQPWDGGSGDDLLALCDQHQETT